MYKYPFNSTLLKKLNDYTKDEEYAIWEQDSFKEKVKNIKLPIIEIGGPTEDGFVFLDSVSLFSEPIITNISENPLPYAENANELKNTLNSK